MLFSSSALLTAALPRAAPDFGPSFVPSTKDNMNGEYVFSSTPGGTPGLFPKKYRDYPGGVDTFDVLSPPMTTHYSQVWWSPLAPSPLPAEVVAKYAGKKMAIVGWEIDQVRQTPEGDKSVPISATYNQCASEERTNSPHPAPSSAELWSASRGPSVAATTSPE
jgi:hypothetical protein